MKRSFSTTVNTNAVNVWLLISRVAIGAIMLTHGLPKLEKLMAGNVQFADPFGIGPTASLAITVFAEVGCSILLILGLATRFAAIPLMITMLVAIFYAHAADPFGKKELPAIFLLIFTGFLIIGAGKYSIDNLISRKSRSRY
ncbi:MAG: DoxX family protein [Segetibacter sp.]|jgi:putative oxidoreductase|nr:DoxX family protein [Segetibacter sp.]